MRSRGGGVKRQQESAHPSESLATHEQVDDDDDEAWAFLSAPLWHDLQPHWPGVHCLNSRRQPLGS